MKFVNKGEILKSDALDKSVAKWRKEMDDANPAAGRTPVPPKTDFAKQLAAIDPGLMSNPEPMDMLQGTVKPTRTPETEIRLSAQDRQCPAGPRFKYIMSKCGVLTRYGGPPTDRTGQETNICASKGVTNPRRRALWRRSSDE